MTTASRRRLRLPLLLVLLLAALAVVLTYVFPFRQMIAQQRAVDLRRQQLAVLQQENARLEAEVQALMTPIELERIAREDFGLVRPGEVSYVVVEPPEPAPAPPAEAPAEPEPRTWLEVLWDFLTGRDLLPDG